MTRSLTVSPAHVERRVIDAMRAGRVGPLLLDAYLVARTGTEFWGTLR